MDNNQPKSDVFPMWGLFYEELHYLRIIKSQAYVRGDIKSYRDVLEEIYTMMSFIIGDKNFKDEALVGNQPNLCKSCMKPLDSDEDRPIEDLFHIAANQIGQQDPKGKSTLKIIDKKLIKCMYTNGFIFSKKRDAGLGLIKRRYQT